MEILLSGIQPTGELHVGNYLGAIKNWINLQQQYQSFFCAVDLHAATVPYDPKLMPKRVKELVATLMACGLGGDKSEIFIQSQVPEHTMLAWLFNCITPLGDLERMTQFKSKSEHFRENIVAGLLTYPILQAADILIYKAEVVPVGEDQVQHIELTREIARRFNNRFAPIFPEPKALLTLTPKIKGLDGVHKMSKSLNNHLPILAKPEERWEKLRTAFTDPARLRRSDKGHPDICNIFSMHKGFSKENILKEIEEGCKSAEIGCVDCKKILSNSMEEVLGPIRERYYAIKDGDIQSEIEKGAKKASLIAKKTIYDVMKAMGMRYE